jgi:hypothetical protein
VVGSITGVVGQIKWSYYTAAAINGYRITRCPGGNWTLRGRVVAAVAFKLSQRPLMFVAPHTQGEWRWPIVECELQDGVVTARLGALEEMSTYGPLPIRSA